MAGKKKRSQRFYDYSLLFTVVFLTIFGLIMIYSASSYKAQIDYDGNAAYFMIRQGLIALGGFVVMGLVKAVVPLLVPIPLSFYFDIFEGLLQAYVFVFLTALFMNEEME